MHSRGPPLCRLEGGGRKPPPNARQGYPSCVVPSARTTLPPCPPPPSASKKTADLYRDYDGSPFRSVNGRSSRLGPPPAPSHYHQLVPQRSRPLPHIPDIAKHYPVLGGFQHPADEPLLPVRFMACCLCGVLVAGFLLYLLYEYVRQHTELPTPHVDVGHVEFVNQVFAHRVADIIRTAASEGPSSTPSTSIAWGVGLTGVLGFKSASPLARVVGGGSSWKDLWARDVNLATGGSRGGGRREMAVEDLQEEYYEEHDDDTEVEKELEQAWRLHLARPGVVREGGRDVGVGGGVNVGVGGGGGGGVRVFRQVCELYPRQLLGNVSGDVDHEHKTLTLSQVRAQHGGDLAPGGEWSPPDCLARYRLAVIIPYRDRLAHLTVLLAHLLPVLKRQQLHFRIFVVEQYGNLTFNKGRIMNAAFKEALKMYDFQCVVFHDVDLIPEDDRNMYSCPIMPRHMSVAINEMNYKLLYNLLVGGVLNLRVEHYQQVNGYSNMYWGWGGEDDDMAYRILHEKLKIIRPPVNIARYQMIKHTKRKPASWNIRSRLLRTAVKRYHLDGLNSVQYTIKFIHSDPLYTHIMVDIGRPDMLI